MGTPSNPYLRAEIDAPDMSRDNIIFRAILHQAVRDAFIGNDKFARRVARAWLLGDSERFRLVCECTGRQVWYIRKKVKQKIEEEKNGKNNLFKMQGEWLH
jgi:hypothetical protein